MKHYVLTTALFHRLSSRKKRPLNMKCDACGKPFKIDDEVISISNRMRSKRFHYECWEKLHY